MIGAEGCLIAMDALADYTKQLAHKVASAYLKNVKVLQRHALTTGWMTPALA